MVAIFQDFTNCSTIDLRSKWQTMHHLIQTIQTIENFDNTGNFYNSQFLLWFSVASRIAFEARASERKGAFSFEENSNCLLHECLAKNVYCGEPTLRPIKQKALGKG